MINLSNLIALYLFQYDRTTFAFDPNSMLINMLEPDEEKFIKTYKELKDFQKTKISLHWDLPHITKVIDNLKRKKLLQISKISSNEINSQYKRIEILVNVAQECNLACKYCFLKQKEFHYKTTKIRMLSPSLIKQFIKLLPEAFPWTDEFCIHFYGGEPLLNLPTIRTAVETVEEMQDPRFIFTITTNGTICTEEALSILRKGRFSIVLSIDGPDYIHDGVRCTPSGKPTHAQVLKFLKDVKTDPPLFVRGSSVIRKGWNLWDAYCYLKSLPVDAIKINAVRLPEDNPLTLSRMERQQYYEDLEKISDEVIESLAKGAYPTSDRFNDRVLELYYRRKRTSFCGAGQRTFGIASDGTILSCALMAGKSDAALGKIQDSNLTWIENGQKWAEDHEQGTKCDLCWASPLCGGNCHAFSSMNQEFECEIIREHCCLALKIYAAFYKNPKQLLLLEKTGSLYQHH